MSIFESHRVSNLIELGCGSGRDALYFVSNRLNVFAFDYSSQAIEQLRISARKSASERIVDAKVHDVRLGLPLNDSSMDAAYSHMFFSMVLSIRELKKIFAEVRRVLRRGAPHLFSVRRIDDPLSRRGTPIGEGLRLVNGFGLRFFEEDLIKSICSNSFEIMKIEGFQEGPSFLYSVYSFAI
jgi:SAM-dependent methyltransferase